MKTPIFAYLRARSVCLAVLALLVAAGAGAQGGGIAVAPVDADAAAAEWADGYGFWLRSHLAQAGLRTLWRGPQLGPSEVLAGADAWGATHVLLPRLREREDAVEVQLLLYAPGSETLLAAPRASGPPGDPGGAIAQTFDALLRHLGAGASRASTPPLLDDLACSHRALAARAEGHLYEAWRAVQGKLSPTAMALRESFVTDARHNDAAPIERARVLAATGDAVGAWRLIGNEARRALDAPKPDAALLVAAGEVQLARNNVRDARQYLDRAASLAADDVISASAQLALARVLELQRDAEAARGALERAARLTPEDPEPYEMLARLDERAPERAASHLMAAAQRSANRLDPHRARHQLQRALELDPRQGAEAHQAVAILDAREGRPAQALATYQQALASGAEGAGLRVGMGRAQRALGDGAGAEASFKRALALDAQNPAALSELGNLYTETGRAQEALPLLEQAHAGASNNAAVRRRYARALQAVGDPRRAIEVLVPDSKKAPPLDLQLAASMRLALGDPQGARALLNRAVQLDPGDAALHEDLARVLEGQGDSAAAAAARTRASQLAQTDANPESGEISAAETPQQRQSVSFDQFVTSFAAQVASADERVVVALGVRQAWGWRSILARMTQPRIPDARAIENGLAAAVAARFQRGALPANTGAVIDAQIDQLYAFESEASLDAHAIGTVNQVLAVDGVFLSKLSLMLEGVEGQCPAGAIQLESRLLMGKHADVASILANSDCLEGGLETYGCWNPLAFGLYALALLVVMLPVIRGWGTIVVAIRLPERTKGFLSIHITTKPDQVRRERVSKKNNREKIRANRRLDFLKRFERHMAARETTFRWIPARKGTYTVTVGGPLLDAQGSEIIGHFLEERPVRVRRGKTQTLEFDFRPKECAVEVNITQDGEIAAGGRAAVWGDRESIRYARDGVAYLYLGLGSYTIAVGTSDSAAAIPLEIKSLDGAIPLQLDFASDYGVVFRGCPQAVDLYLQGDLAGAARALEANGDVRAAQHMRGILYERQGRSDDAAREFESAGLIEDAARLRATGSDFGGSAALFEQAGENEQAADAYRAAGQFSDAARCYEKVYDYHSALECWREVGDAERELDLLEKMGEYIEAGALARQQLDLDRAISNLQQIDHRHANYADACREIAEILNERGDYDLAASKYEEAIASVGAENASVEVLEGFGSALERAGRQREAIGAYEAVCRRDARRDDVAARIERLRRESRDAPTRAAASAAPAESRYELLEELGRGGMGVVYKARDTRLGRIVALKRLPETLREHPRAVELFEREARAAAALNHVNIVTLFDAGEENGTYFITMELLEGRALNEIVELHGRLSTRDVARLGIQIATGLQYAHDQRIVHRDIKSANLFFTRDQVVKIMDFGIAKSLEEVRRSTTIVGGTPFYMAPEQASGKPVDHRADLYAFGVTLFQLATGTLPFPDGDVTYRHRHEPAPDPREVDAAMPEALAHLLLALMAKEPEQRPASAAQVGAALRVLLAQTSA